MLWDTCIKNLRFKGSLFTWCNKKESEDKITCKLDRVFVNEQWKDECPLALANFKPNGVSDHSFC